MFFRLFLLFFVVFACCGEELTFEFDGKFYRIGNTHLLGQQKNFRGDDLLLVSKVRDLFLSSVKNPSNCVFDEKNPSKLSVRSKIKLKSDGKNLTGEIIALDKYYLQTDIPFARGDSGKIVYDMSDKPVGLVSHYVVQNGRTVNFIIRIDNLQKSEFEILKSSAILRDWRVFNEYKEHEYKIFNGLQKCSTSEEMRKFLLSQMILRKEYIGWQSTYLKNETDKSRKTVRNIYERFLNEKSSDTR